MDEPAPTPLRRPTVPWGAAELVLALLVSYALDISTFQFLHHSGWFTWLYGPVPTGPIDPADTEAVLTRMRLSLWVHPLAVPLKVGFTLMLLRLSSGVRPIDLGLHFKGLGRNVLLGLLLAVALTPAAYGINALMVLLIEDLGGAQQPHTFTKLAQAPLAPIEWALLVLTAVVAAPLWEELFYRGVVQPWVIDRQPIGGLAALAPAFALTVVTWRGWAAGTEGPTVVDFLPLGVLLVLTGAYGIVARRSPLLGAIFAVAILFGWAHLAAWPQPVPLVWLAVGLGWLAYRSGGLVGPIVLHAVFNAVPCVVLIWQAARAG